MAIPPRAIDSILHAVGRTPLVRLSAFERPGGPALYAKCEFLGPGNSLFDRAARAEFQSATRAGHLVPGTPLVAAGGSDASLSLALVAAAVGCPLTLLVPRSLHPERRRALQDYGAKLESLDDATGYVAANERAFDKAGEQHGLYVNLFEGKAVVASYEHVAAELVEALGAAPTLTVCGLDLGAIPTGLARGLSGAALVAVEPENARIGSGGPFGPHLLGGLAPSDVPLALDRALVTDFEAVSDRDAWDAAEALSARAGLLAGIASGAVLVAAQRRAKSLGPDATVVAVLPDTGERRFALAPFFA